MKKNALKHKSLTYTYRLNFARHATQTVSRVYYAMVNAETLRYL